MATLIYRRTKNLRAVQLPSLVDEGQLEAQSPLGVPLSAHRDLLRGRRVSTAVAAHDAVDHHHADARHIAELHALQQRACRRYAVRGP